MGRLPDKCRLIAEFGIFACVLVLQAVLKRTERRSVFRLRVPTLAHDCVQRRRAVRWLRESVALIHLSEHLGVCHAGIGRATERHKLGEENAIGPHLKTRSVRRGKVTRASSYVALNRESIVECRFGSSPFDGELRALFGFVHPTSILLERKHRTRFIALNDDRSRSFGERGTEKH